MYHKICLIGVTISPCTANLALVVCNNNTRFLASCRVMLSELLTRSIFVIIPRQRRQKNWVEARAKLQVCIAYLEAMAIRGLFQWGTVGNTDHWCVTLLTKIIFEYFSVKQLLYYRQETGSFGTSLTSPNIWSNSNAVILCLKNVVYLGDVH